MPRLNILASFVLLSGALVQCQDTSQSWALGTKVSIMAVSKGLTEADRSTKCPAKLSDAQAAPQNFLPVQANLDLGIIVGGVPNPDGKLIESFYLTNGVAFGQIPLVETPTRIKVDGHNLCWFRAANDGNVRLGRCGTEFPDQAFSVVLPAQGQTTTGGIYTTDGGGGSVAVMYEIPARVDTPIIFGDGSEFRVCIYDTRKGVPLSTPADQAAAYTAQVTWSNLTSTSFKDGAPKSESESPQCNWAAWGEDGPNGTARNIQESSSSPDCILTRTAATMPMECADDPTNGDCILHVVLAFCGDRPELRQNLPAAESNGVIEACVRKASQGPCVANPTGAACASGLFAGITFVDGANGGGSGSASARLRRKLDLKSLFFGDPNNPDSELSFESQFFMGIFKNLFNSAATALNLLATPFVEELRWKCQDASMWVHLFNNDAGIKVRNGCAKTFATWDNSSVPHLDPSTPFEEAGSIFADVAMLLSAVGDVAEAAKAVSTADWVVGKFGLKAAQLGKGEGLVLEAVEGENTVQIFRNAGDGKPALIETEAEGEALAREVEESAFRDCVECIEPGLAKRQERYDGLLRPRAPVRKKLCCGLGLNLKLDVPPPPDLPRPVNMRTLGAVSGEEANNVLSSMSTSFGTWYKDGKAVLAADASVDDTSQLLLSTTKTIKSKSSEMIEALEKLYGIDTKESYALKSWFGSKQASRMLPGLEEAMAKMPYATGTAIRSTNLDAETIKMLDEGAAGIVSQGQKGVYEVRDLVINKDPMYPNAPAERKILAATMGLDDSALTFNGRYFFVINSKSGRLAAPFSGEWLREVDFVQGSSGKFRLIGKQELNGGAKAAAEPGAKGPFAVYYFDEVEVPTAPASFTTDQVTQALKDANVKWEGNP